MADSVKTSKEWLWQFLETLEGIASDLSIIGSFDSFHERQCAADPKIWGGDPFEYLQSVCVGDLFNLWPGMIDDTIGLYRILHHGRDRIYGAGLPLEEVKDQIERASDILLDVGGKGEAMRSKWRDIALQQTALTDQGLLNEVFLEADGFAQHIRCLQFESKLRDVICRLRGYAVRRQAELTGASEAGVELVRVQEGASKRIDIDLDKFSKTGSLRLLQDLIKDARADRKGVTLDDNQHGSNQPKNLRGTLRHKGLSEVASAIKKVNGRTRTWILNLSDDQMGAITRTK